MSDYEPFIDIRAESEKVEIVLFKSHAQGLIALLHWCDGFEKSNQGRIPGKFELVMHIRELRRASQAAGISD